MAKSRYKYLGKRVEDRGKEGLDSAREFYDIMEAIMQDYRKGKIRPSTARGRLLALYRSSFKKKNSKIKHLSNKTLARIRKRIKTLMSEIKGR